MSFNVFQTECPSKNVRIYTKINDLYVETIIITDQSYDFLTKTVMPNEMSRQNYNKELESHWRQHVNEVNSILLKLNIHPTEQIDLSEFLASVLHGIYTEAFI